MKTKKMLDKALQFLVNMETDIPCEEMYGYGYCEKKLQVYPSTKRMLAVLSEREMEGRII